MLGPLTILHFCQEFIMKSGIEDAKVILPSSAASFSREGDITLQNDR
jgi:hypothetical protein